ncbi:Uncharacterised protein [Serratia proteamaculans]|nr:Uncharacterised protein [Serratia proteamaculans]
MSIKKSDRGEIVSKGSDSLFCEFNRWMQHTN